MKPLPPENPQSPARAELTRLRQELRAAGRAVAAAKPPVARLESVIAAAEAARARQAQSDLGLAQRLADWAESGISPEPAAPDKPRPAPDASKAAAAQTALAAARQRLAEAESARASLAQRLPPAIAAVLREDGAARVAAYWRHYAGLESLRRELAALDQVLLADFPVSHPATGRPILDFVSPDKLSASDAMRAAKAACVAVPAFNDFTRAWRDSAAAL
jgi:hypothetical protein